MPGQYLSEEGRTDSLSPTIFSEPFGPDTRCPITGKYFGRSFHNDCIANGSIRVNATRKDPTSFLFRCCRVLITLQPSYVPPLRPRMDSHLRNWLPSRVLTARKDWPGQCDYSCFLRSRARKGI